ncbi:hypothetical protein RUM43_014981 [Polyplax serrata]|uniref:Centrosome-associated FAM110 C-terminal domain-containing protein n=1 Tax=Polyplax serrata TaxID=468196 RepID=A0AAN8S2F8_POLSC
MTTKLRHPQVACWRPTHTKTNLTGRHGCSAKRKSAVQMLQETKAFYVKSETVLDKKQEFKPGRESAYSNYGHVDERESNLQDKLRLLLDFDSMDNRNITGKTDDPVVNLCTLRGCDQSSTCFQHKSLPDLHRPPSYSSAESSVSSFDVKCDGDSRSAYSSFTQPDCHIHLCCEPEKCKYRVQSLRGSNANEFQFSSRLYTSFRVAKSGEFINTKNATGNESSCRRRRSNTSSCNRSRHNSSSKHSQSADSGRQSQGGSVGLRTGRSGLPEFPSPPPKTVWSDSGTEDDFPPLFKNEGYATQKKRPILRSKSDVSYKYCISKANSALPPIFRPMLQSTEKLEIFFDHLGMDPLDYKELACSNSGNSSPVYFSSVSSVDSCVEMSIWTVPETCKVTECPSIVERNARIIKWLYNCRKYQKTVSKDGNIPLISSET